jgi:regulator of cell morphogenesis and NO signaling
MELFNENSKLASVIHKDHSLLPVINRLGVKLGFGDRTIREICEAEGIDANFFVEIINVFHYEGYFPEKKLLGLSVASVIDYLKKTHRYYIQYLFPETDRLMQLFLQSCGGQCPENELVRKFYDKFRNECVLHFQTEEVEEFPYILELNEVVGKGEGKSRFFEKYGDFSLRNFEEEHINIDDKIFDLENIIIMYLPPNYDQNVGNTLLANLFQFAKDLKNHSRIEDLILLPKVQQLEDILHQNG